MKQAHRFSGPGRAYEGLTELGPNGPRWTGKVVTVPEALDAPLHWKKPARVFVNSMSDLFHEDVPHDFISQVFAVMALCPQHTFQILTKRPARMLEYMNGLTAGAMREAAKHLSGYPGADPWDFDDQIRFRPIPLPNVWLGVSAENQETADERIPLLLQTPAAVRFVSYEPALGPVDLSRLLGCWCGHLGNDDGSRVDIVCPFHDRREKPKINWIIVGGESGPGARPFEVEWARSIVAQCQAADVPVFVKQMGSHVRGKSAGFLVNRFEMMPGDWWTPPIIVIPALEQRVKNLRANAIGFQTYDAKGGDPSQWPEDLRVREFPK